MAKKNVSALMAKILKNSTTKNTAILSESKFFNDKDAIPTEIPIINVAFSGELNGGISSGLTLMAGASRTFKTNIALVCVKAYLNKYEDAVCIFYDSEGGTNPEYLLSQGVDPSRVVHIPIDHLEMLKFDLIKQLSELERGDKVIFVIDSIGNTASLKELEDALAEKSVAEMQRAKAIKGLFRMITPSLVNKDLPCIAICHTYSTMELYSKSVISGGCLVAGTKIKLSNGTLKNIEDITLNDNVLTLEGEKEVTHIWNPETLENGAPECYEIEFEDGYKVICSDKHKFLIDNNWVEAKDLQLDDRVAKL